MKKMLVVYYSWSNGNTKQIAEQLAKATGAELAEIDTVQPYTGSYPRHCKTRTDILQDPQM